MAKIFRLVLSYNIVNLGLASTVYTSLIKRLVYTYISNCETYYVYPFGFTSFITKDRVEAYRGFPTMRKIPSFL